MTERASRTGVRRYRSRKEAAQLAAEFKASGLTRREFCDRHQVALNTLNRYISRYSGHQPAHAPEFVRVQVRDSDCTRAGVSVVLGGGRRVELDRGFDAATLRAAISVIERV
jgi:hypothetical protein